MNFFKAGMLLLVAYGDCFAAAGSAAAFEQLQNLRGKWAIQSEGKVLSIEMAYDIGSIVTEQFGKELSVFYRDGGSLMMIHFCNRGNQPRLRLKEGSNPKLLEFETFETTNLKSPGAGHVQRVVYRILSDKKVDVEIVWPEGPEKYSLSKI